MINNTDRLARNSGPLAFWNTKAKGGPPMDDSVLIKPEAMVARKKFTGVALILA